MFSATVISGTGDSSWWIIEIPSPSAAGRVGDLDLLAAEFDRPCIGLVHADEDLHQRGLAGAVLAHQGVDGPGTDFEVDVVERLDAREGLGDALHPEEVVVAHRLHEPCPHRRPVARP